METTAPAHCVPLKEAMREASCHPGLLPQGTQVALPSLSITGSAGPCESIFGNPAAAGKASPLFRTFTAVSFPGCGGSGLRHWLGAGWRGPGVLRTARWGCLGPRRAAACPHSGGVYFNTSYMVELQGILGVILREYFPKCVPWDTDATGCS